jgi:hypothetical protein
MTVEPSGAETPEDAPSAEHDGGTSDPGAVKPDLSEVKRKFREALERKQHQQHASAAGGVHDGSEKSHGAKGPTKGRSFRRKAI